MHPRFAGAKRIEITCPDGVLEAAVAESFRLRLRGLMGLRPEEIEPVLFPGCRSIHTFGMKGAIDVVWLEQNGNRARVIDLVTSLEPRRGARAPRCGAARRRIAALELAPGEADRLRLIPAAEVALNTV